MRFRNDSWENVGTGVGNTALDKRLQARVLPARSNYTYVDFENLYHGNDTARKGATVYPEEMTRKWFDLTFGSGDEGTERDLRLDAEQKVTPADIQAHLEDLGAQEAFCQALTWGNVFGGGLVYMDVDDGRRALSTPLKPERVKKLRGLVVLDRWEMQTETYFNDPRKTNYGHPQHFTFNTSLAPNMGVEKELPFVPKPTDRIHASRFLIFDGLPVTRRRRIENTGWGDSIYISSWDVIRDFSQTWGSIFAILQDFAQPIYKMSGLTEAMMSNNEQLVRDRMAMLEFARSSLRAIPLDAQDEDFKREVAPLTAMPDMLDRLSERLAFTFDMPLTRLMGRSPAGLNSTGDGDTRFFYDRVRSKWIRLCKPQTEKLSRVAMYAMMNREPKLWSVSLPSLWEPSAVDEAKRREANARADERYINSGAVKPEDVGQSRFGGDEYGEEIVYTGPPESAPDKGTGVPDGGTNADNPDDNPDAGDPGGESDDDTGDNKKP